MLWLDPIRTEDSERPKCKLVQENKYLWVSFLRNKCVTAPELAREIPVCTVKESQRFLPATLSYMEATLSFWGEDSNTSALIQELVSSHLSGTSHPEQLQNKRVFLFRSLDPNLVLDASPTIFSWYCSISCTNSGFLPTREVTFHI